MPGPKITDHEVRVLVEKGKNLKEMAEELGVNKSTVFRRMKRLGIYKTSQAAYEASLMLQGDVDGMKALEDLYRRTSTLLEVLEEAWKGQGNFEELQQKMGRTSLIDGLLATKKELRNQLNLMANISEKIFNIHQVRQFQKLVIAEIQKANPDVAQQIVRQLVQINQAYNYLDPQGRAREKTVQSPQTTD